MAWETEVLYFSFLASVSLWNYIITSARVMLLFPTWRTMSYCRLGLKSISVLPSLHHLRRLYQLCVKSLGLFWRGKVKLWFWLAGGDNVTECLPVPKNLLLELKMMICTGLVSSGSRTNGGYWPILMNLSYMTLPCLEFILFSSSVLA